MTRKQRLIQYIAETKYLDINNLKLRKQYAKEYLNGLNNLEFLELLDEVCGDK